MSATTTTTKGDLLEAIEREREAWEALLAEVGEDRMLEAGPMGEWTFKDLVAHLNGWRARFGWQICEIPLSIRSPH